jgi:hypothetical protein
MSSTDWKWLIPCDNFSVASDSLHLKVFLDAKDAFVHLINQIVRQFKAKEIKILSATVQNEGGKKDSDCYLRVGQ